MAVEVRASMRPLNPDYVGEVGEGLFKVFCASAGLVCNKSDRDRTGWDFIVEFPFEVPGGERTLDKRGSALSCHVQVKTIWADTKRIALSLSSAEHIAKEPKPAFIYVLLVNDDRQPVDSYLIHLRGKNLGHVLKRLRKAHATGKLKINDAEITFNPKTAGIRLAPNGDALRRQLEQECGPNPQAYIASKDLEHFEVARTRWF